MLRLYDAFLQVLKDRAKSHSVEHLQRAQAVVVPTHGPSACACVGGHAHKAMPDRLPPHDRESYTRARVKVEYAPWELRRGDGRKRLSL